MANNKSATWVAPKLECVDLAATAQGNQKLNIAIPEGITSGPGLTS